MTRSKIVGLGFAVPSKVLTNADIEQMVDTSDEWIVERTGIRARRILDKERCTSDLAAEAGLAACTNAGIAPSELGAIIVGTVTPDAPMPATAVHVQQKIGAGQCPAFDISAACAGFLFGLSVADGFIARSSSRPVLVIGVEILSRIVDWTDRNTCVLFGDGAGAAVLAPAGESDESGLIDIILGTDGAGACHLDIPAGGTREPATHLTVEAKRHFVQMNGRQVFTQAVRNMSASSLAVLDNNGYRADHVTTVFAHQANMRIIEGVSQRTAIPMSKFYNNISKYGNTSSASVPISMAEALAEGRIARGDLLLLTALGAGISWGAALVRW
jgi:3-oxoacyl-[acyl-carrier-protein] synthase-3